MSADQDSARGKMSRSTELLQWIHQLRKEIPIEEIIDRVRLRLQNADADEQFTLELELHSLLTQIGRYDEALQLIENRIEEQPGNVRPLISKASHYYYYREDLLQALKWIDVALDQAFRTRFFVREALGTKARILLDLGGRGEELGQVLEQIMSLDTYRGIPDIGKERDFVDRAPPGLIREDIVARYDKFCPKRDPALELHRWVRDLGSKIPEGEVIDRVQSRLRTASADDQLTLTYILGILLMNVGRFDEALPLLDRVIEQQPDHVRCVLAKAAVHVVHRDDPEKALELIDLALERAFRTRFYRRQVLGEKARILLKLGRGEELGQVLEQIMSLQMFSDVRDTGRERDFVDRAPPGLIAADIVARYDQFCPKIDG